MHVHVSFYACTHIVKCVQFGTCISVCVFCTCMCVTLLYMCAVDKAWSCVQYVSCTCWSSLYYITYTNNNNMLLKQYTAGADSDIFQGGTALHSTRLVLLINSLTNKLMNHACHTHTQQFCLVVQFLLLYSRCCGSGWLGQPTWSCLCQLLYYCTCWYSCLYYMNNILLNNTLCMYNLCHWYIGYMNSTV